MNNVDVCCMMDVGDKHMSSMCRVKELPEAASPEAKLPALDRTSHGSSSETDDRRSEADRNTFAMNLPGASMSGIAVQYLYARYVRAVDAANAAKFRLFQRPKDATRRPLDLVSFTLLFPRLQALPHATVTSCYRLFRPYDAVTCIQVLQFLDLDPHRFVFDWFTASMSFPGGKLKKKNVMYRKELHLLLETAHVLSGVRDVGAESFPEMLTRDQFAAALPPSLVKRLLAPFAVFSQPDGNDRPSDAPSSSLQFAVAIEWWQSWRAYADPSDSDNNNNEHESDGPCPPSIYNQALADAMQTSDTLLDGVDYVTVSPKTWHALQSRFGGGPALPCYNGVYRLVTLAIALSERDGRPSPQSRSLQVPPSARLVDLKDVAVALHDVNMEARLWCRDADGHWVLVASDLTAADVTSSELLLETRPSNATEWPRILLRTPRDFRPLRIGDAVDAFDCEQVWRPGVVHRVSTDGTRVLVSFVGFHAMYNEWIHHDSGKLQPRHSRADSDRGLWPSPIPRLNPGYAGAVGLLNLGNTCFLNCALQCLAATPILRSYLLSTQYAGHINKTNPLGTKGKVVSAVANVVASLWAPTGTIATTTVSPSALRKLVAKARPQFDSYDQQDAHEYMAALLDAIHEDVKRSAGFLEPTADDDAAWRAHVAGNHSIVTDVFHGLLQSQTVCDACDHRSISHDPFLCFSLSIPVVLRCALRILVFRQDASPKVCDVALPSNEGALRTVLDDLGCQLQTSPSVLRLVHVQNHRFVRVLSPDTLVCDIEGATIYCFERLTRLPTRLGMPVAVVSDPRLRPETGVLAGSDADTLTVAFASGIKQTFAADVWYRTVKPMTKEGIVDLQVVHRVDGQLGGIPFVLSLGSDRTTAELHAAINKELRRLVATTAAYTIAAMAMSNPGKTVDVPCDTTPFLRYVTPPEVVVLEWTASPMFVDDFASALRPVTRDVPELTLRRCLESFMATERMGVDWACEQCQSTSGGTRYTDLSRSPDILMLHLKRFHYSSVQHHKVNELVTFPLEGLDLTPYLHKVPSDVNSGLYDLFAVANHTGGLSEGHYTTYCRFDLPRHDVSLESALPTSHVWLCFDDEVVCEIPASKVVSNAAYVLFYKRRLPSSTSQLYAL
ncbi:hypothetical protein SDRG_00104 [Saprolegnia diclina VS20]|uniref:Uncharacterized protein n=1 Tax=Saprolegnia diclina (strain VS20) TaxID=1156394 RepID=T0R600_SAPDV|nr:hypothetical protein SDRG_00104 [Saprolegnia diclina VS20]EQC42366.1 hypothetical protein SDRG_00104 [Saprolegnia diclina VS20]|eukprot:XP_008603789.1 hypothetical protein SDRG_00104 [Saprolegnia diclina VS20]